ncbi:MAG: sigma 54-interacting transcriptional regulator, partial [Nitrososphaera sp.]
MSKLLGNSPAFRDVIALVRRAALKDAPVLIEGETGTGKDLVAGAIHELSNRKDQPFMPINCAAIPETLLESEVFGYSRGAFTGADSDRWGLLRLADRGTIFFDEVGELPVNLQAKLLRALDTKTFIPLGGSKEVKVNVRVISASNRDLRKHTEVGLIRPDFYYRISAIYIHLPPLRDR